MYLDVFPAGIASTAVRLRPKARAWRWDVPVQVMLRIGICRSMGKTGCGKLRILAATWIATPVVGKIVGAIIVKSVIWLEAVLSLELSSDSA